MAVPRPRIIGLAVLVVALAAASPALAGGTRGNFDRPPYVDGKPKGAVRPAAHAPVIFRSEPGSLDPGPDKSPALAALLDSLAEEIGRLGLTPALAGESSAGSPDVAFGCRRGGTGSDGMPLASDEIDEREPRRMAFDVEDAKKTWRDWLRTATADSIRGVVTVQLGFGEYWVRQKDWKGNKVIDLSSARAMPLEWLTSLDDPVQVLQLTGALVSRDGKIQRVGAVGLIARRTGMTASVLGAQEVLTEPDLKALQATAEGSVPVWRVALRELVALLLEGR